jgi:hypothetical protein
MKTFPAPNVQRCAQRLADVPPALARERAYVVRAMPRGAKACRGYDPRSETAETRWPRIYVLLKARHDPAKAAEILRDAKRKEAHARIWIKTHARSRCWGLH